MPETLRSLVRPNMPRGPGASAASRDLTGVRLPFRPGTLTKISCRSFLLVLCAGCVSAEQICLKPNERQHLENPDRSFFQPIGWMHISPWLFQRDVAEALFSTFPLGVLFTMKVERCVPEKPAKCTSHFRSLG